MYGKGRLIYPRKQQGKGGWVGYQVLYQPTSDLMVFLTLSMRCNPNTCTPHLISSNDASIANDPPPLTWLNVLNFIYLICAAGLLLFFGQKLRIKPLI